MRPTHRATFVFGLIALLAAETGCRSVTGARPGPRGEIQSITRVGDRALPPTVGEPGGSALAARDKPRPEPRPADRQGQISGRVVDADGQPVGGATVRVAVDGSTRGRTARGETDRAGGFTLSGLEPGIAYTLIAEADAEDDGPALVGRRSAEAPDDRVTIRLAEPYFAEAEPPARRRVGKVSELSPVDAEGDSSSGRRARLNREDLPPADDLLDPTAAEVADEERPIRPRPAKQARPRPSKQARTTGWRPGGGDEPVAAAGEPAAEVEDEPTIEPAPPEPVAEPAPALELPPSTAGAPAEAPATDPEPAPASESVAMTPPADEPPTIDEPSADPAPTAAPMVEPSPSAAPAAEPAAEPSAAPSAEAPAVEASAEPATSSEPPGPDDSMGPLGDPFAAESPEPEAPIDPAPPIPEPEPLAVAPRRKVMWGDLPEAPGPAVAASAPAESTGAEPATALAATEPWCKFDAKRLQLVDFELPDLQGKATRFSELGSDLVLLDFWGTWCEPCVESIPHLVELQSRLGADKLTVVGIAYEQGPTRDHAAKVATAARRLGINYPVLVARSDGTCPLQSALHVDVYPTLVLVDRDGKVLWRDKGATPTTLARLDRAIASSLDRADVVRR